MNDAEKAMLPERGHCALLEAHAALRGRPAAAGPGFVWTAPGCSWGNSCHSVRIPAGRSGSLSALDAKMCELRCTAVTGPDEHGADASQEETERVLAEAGFILLRVATGMIIDAQDIAPSRIPEGFAVEEPANEEALLTWSGIVTRCLFDSPDPRYAESFAESAGLLRDAGALDVFLCRDGKGAPVSASASFIAGDGLGGVYFVATEPGSRRLGLGAAVTSIAATRCAERGVDPVVLHATDLGRPVYEGIGFRTVATMRRWKARPEP